jgi:dual specificity MAP kinase phosphatase
VLPTGVIPGVLYLGSYDTASRSELLKQMGITHILNVGMRIKQYLRSPTGRRFGPSAQLVVSCMQKGWCIHRVVCVPGADAEVVLLCIHVATADGALMSSLVQEHLHIPHSLRVAPQL